MKKFGILSHLFTEVRRILFVKPSVLVPAKPQNSLVPTPCFMDDIVARLSPRIQFHPSLSQIPCRKTQGCSAVKAGSKACLKYEMNNRLGRRHIFLMEVIR